MKNQPTRSFLYADRPQVSDLKIKITTNRNLIAYLSAFYVADIDRGIQKYFKYWNVILTSDSSYRPDNQR